MSPNCLKTTLSGFGQDKYHSGKQEDLIIGTHTLHPFQPKTWTTSENQNPIMILRSEGIFANPIKQPQAFQLCGFFTVEGLFAMIFQYLLFIKEIIFLKTSSWNVISFLFQLEPHICMCYTYDNGIYTSTCSRHLLKEERTCIGLFLFYPSSSATPLPAWAGPFQGRGFDQACLRP